MIKEKVAEDVIVYKYRDWSNKLHRKVLKSKHQIYFASPNTFNDPFDCRINYNFSCLSDKDREGYIDDRIEFLKEVKRVDESNEKFERNSIRKELEYPEKLHKEFNEIYNSRIGVFCCCQDEEIKKGWQNILMWSHYANDHKGFCVGFYKDKLNCEVKSNLPNQMLKGGLVDYNEEFPILKPLVPISKNMNEIGKNYMTGVKTKAINWEYENEYRLVRINLDSNEPELKNRTVNLTNDCIAEVTLGLSISKCHEEQITEICRKKNIRLYKAVKTPLKFSITRKEIYLS